MSRAERQIIAVMERDAARSARRARYSELDAMAQRAVSVPLSSASDSITFLRCVAGQVLKRLIILDSKHHAASYFAALSRGDDYRRLSRDLAWEEAGRLFAPKAANDGGAG